MKHKYKQVLIRIVEIEGNCLVSTLCDECPFRKSCLPEFLNKKKRPSRKERYEMAADTLARLDLMLDDLN